MKKYNLHRVWVFVALFAVTQVHAYRIALSPGSANCSSQSADKSLWPYSAANAECGKYGGTWGNTYFTPSALRSQIVGNFTTKIGFTEEIYFNGDLDGNGDPIPPSWITNNELPGNFKVSVQAGSDVHYMNMYNANYRSYNTAAELEDARAVFESHGYTNINFGTIIRRKDAGWQTFLQPYGHFLFEIRVDTVVRAVALRNALIETTIWGLDNDKEVFLQLLPQGNSNDYESDMIDIMELLYNEIGAERFASSNLWFTPASYDASAYDTVSTPEMLHGENHHNTLTGVCKTMLERRDQFHAGNFTDVRDAYDIEAESASSQSNFSPWTVANASGKTYVVWPGTIVNASAPGNLEGTLEYTFTTSEEGNVGLDAFVEFATEDEDGFWYRIDDQPWVMEIGENSVGFKWVHLGRFYLLEGAHTLTIARRRGNSKIDKFRLLASKGTIGGSMLIAAAGADQNVIDYDDAGMVSVTLDGSASAADAGTISAYSWSTGGVEIATGVAPTVELPQGTHDIQLIITESSSLTATGQVEVVVRANDHRIVVENSTSSVSGGSTRVAGSSTHYISSFRVGTGSFRKLVVMLGTEHEDTLSVKYGTKALTLAKAQDDNSAHCSIWYLDNPPSGVSDINISGTDVNGSSVGVISMYNAAPGVAFTAGINDERITYTPPTSDTLVVGAYSDYLQDAGPSAPLENKTMTSGGWGGSALAGWEQLSSGAQRTDTYRAPASDQAIATVGFIGATWATIEAETASAQTNFSPFSVQTDLGGPTYIEIPNGTGNVNGTEVTDLSGMASYTFSLAAPADVGVEAYALLSNFGNDDFWHRMDGGAWTLRKGPNFEWSWVALKTYTGLTAGEHTVDILRAEDGIQIDQLRFSASIGDVTINEPSAPLPTFGNGGIPGTGNPWTLGNASVRIEAENYDVGIEGQADHDTPSGNTGGAYRSDDVDVQVCSDTGGGYNTGYTVAGEWMQYTVDVQQAGEYVLSLRTARFHAGASSARVWFGDEDKTGLLTVPSTGDWQGYTTISINVSLAAGVQPMRLELTGGSFNVNYIELARVLPELTADAGADQSVVDAALDGIETVMLDGTGSFGGPVYPISSYVWKRGSQPIATGANPSVELPLGTHLISLLVTDSNGGTSSDSTLISIDPGTAAAAMNLLAGWEIWNTGASSPATRTDGIAASGANNGYSISADGSTDGTWGTITTPVADQTTDLVNDSAFLPNGASGFYDFTLTETSGTARNLTGFHFDSATFRPSSSRDYELSVLSGDLTVGPVASGNVPSVVAGAQDWSNIDIDLTALADHVLDANGSVTFRLALTNGTVGASGHHQYLDNVGISESVEVNAYPDHDGNGLPDYWEILYLGNTGQVAGVDFDGDGLTTGDELIAGTDPGDINSRFVIHYFEEELVGEYTFKWDSYSDRTYTVMKGASLTSNVWNSVSGNLPGTGGEMFFIDDEPVSPSNMFYKIQVTQP